MTVQRNVRYLGRQAAVLVAILIAIAGLTGCEEDVTAVTGTDLPYSLYGVISPQLDSQWVRVYPIESTLEPAKPEPLGATVVSTDLTTGETFEWRDSLLVDFADQYAHVYWAPFQADHEHTYRIEVRSPGGSTSQVEVGVPPLSEIVLAEPQLGRNDVVLPVIVPGDIPRVLAAEVVFDVSYLPFGAPELVSNSFTIPHYTEPHPVESGWRIGINLNDAFDDIRGRVSRILGQATLDARVGVLLHNVTVRLIVGNAEWDPPEGRFDAELIVQPGVMENVSGGFGFVGAGYRLSRTWVPPDTALVLSGFRAPED